MLEPLENLFKANPQLATIVSASPFVNIIALFLIYRIFFHQLRHIPGPFWASVSSFWLWWHVFRGTECSAVAGLHRKLGPVVRIGPDDIDISDPAAIDKIYIDGGGFAKPPYYASFDIDGHETIFSTRDLSARAKLAKPIFSMLSSKNIREGIQAIEVSVARFVEILKQVTHEKDSSKENLNPSAASRDVLEPSRELALDTITSYLLGKEFGALSDGPKLYKNDFSAAMYVDFLVDQAKFFLVPSFLVNVLSFYPNMFRGKRVNSSFAAVRQYLQDVIKSASPEDDTYQGRLLKAGFSKTQTTKQCTDLFYAGIDSTGSTIATILWLLAKNKSSYNRLHKEVMANTNEPEAQAIPYLRAVIQEGLRLSMINPTRLPRVVPTGGWAFGGFSFPEGTIVGCSSYMLHHDSTVFPDPFKFKPERWLDPTEEMAKSSFAFGAGTRSCIARNLANAQLYVAIRRTVEADVLRNARPVQDKLERLEWFQSRFKTGKVELQWS